MKKFIPLFLLTLISLCAKSQTDSPKHLISQIDFIIRSELRNKGGRGTIKYEYNSNNQVVALTVFDKINLDNVIRVSIKNQPNKIIIKDNLREQTINTDGEGRIIEGTYLTPTAMSEWLFSDFNYKFTYLNGYLSRINSYKDDKLYQIHNLVYEGGNLIGINNSFNGNPGYTSSTYYQISYYDKPTSINMNYVMGIYLYPQTERFTLFGFPGGLLGNQSKNLIKSITATYKYGNILVKTYNLDYQFNSDGSVSQININTPGSDGNITSTFNITYKN